MDNVKDITVEILISIRDEIREMKDEIRELREDTNKRFEQIDMRLRYIENDLKAIVSYFNRDYMLLANKVDELDRKFNAHIGSHN
jgi:predicted  nucleic acid-binding Zn-ribbon protein